MTINKIANNTIKRPLFSSYYIWYYAPIIDYTPLNIISSTKKIKEKQKQTRDGFYLE